MCGRATAECQGERMQKKEKAKELELVRREFEVSKESVLHAVGREKTEEHVLK